MKKTKRYWRILAKRRGKLCDLLQDQVDELEFRCDLLEKSEAELGIVPPVPPFMPAFRLGDPDWTKVGQQLGEDFKTGIRYATATTDPRIAELEATVRAQEQTIITREQENARLERANARWADRAYELTGERDRALEEMRKRPRVGGFPFTVVVQADEQLKRTAAAAQERERAAVKAGRAAEAEAHRLGMICVAAGISITEPALSESIIPERPRDSIVEPTGDEQVDEMLDAATRPLYAETAGMRPMISHPIKSCGSLFSHPHHVWDAIVGDQAEPHYCEGIAQP